jgi:hypothetical protein
MNPGDIIWSFGRLEYCRVNIIACFGLIRLSGFPALRSILSVSSQESVGKVRRTRSAADNRPRPQPFSRSALLPAALSLSSDVAAFAKTRSSSQLLCEKFFGLSGRLHRLFYTERNWERIRSRRARIASPVPTFVRLPEDSRALGVAEAFIANQADAPPLECSSPRRVVEGLV